MSQVITLAATDLRRWVRSPGSLLAALVPSAGMTALLVVLTLSVGRQPVALVVLDQGTPAQVMEHIITADTEAYAVSRTDAQSAERLLADQRVAAVIVIPPGFGRAAAAGGATVDLTLNNVDIDFADDIRRTLARSVAQFDAPQLGVQGELLGSASGIVIPSPYRIAVQENDLRETTVDLLHYQVIPALVLLVLSVGLIGTALLCAEDVISRTARQLLVAPVRPWVLVAGRLAGGSAAAIAVTLPAVALLATTRVISPPAGHWPAVATLLLCTGICGAGLGAALGSVLTHARTVALAASTLATWLFLLGGGFTTIAFLPDWVQRVSAVVPFRYAIDGLRSSLFYADPHDIARDILVLVWTAAVSVALGAATVRRAWTG